VESIIQRKGETMLTALIIALVIVKVIKQLTA